MHFLRGLLLAAAFAPQLITGRSIEKRQLNIPSWIAAEVPIAWNGLYRNVGNTGEFAKNVDAGAVIASPSTASPNYFFQWTRDSALVFKVILDQWLKGDSSVESHLRNYITESNKLQRTSNPSGDYYSGGLGEPKFHVNGAAFTEGWGRPQLDGPPLRAIVLTEFANKLLERGETSYVTSNLYKAVLPYDTVIKADLEYTANNWQQNGFDLWEEVNARHFFTLIVSRRALLAGADLADRLNDSGAGTWYRQQANAIGNVLTSSFWSSSGNYLLTTVNTNNGRSQLDCGTLLGSLHGNGAKGYGLFGPETDEVLATLDALVDRMHSLYPINSNGALGVAIGRYPEDVYDGVGTSIGHPWFICTFTTAEIVYNAVASYKKAGSLTVGTKSLNFIKKFLSSATAGTVYASGASDFDTIVNGMLAWADNQVGRGATHASNNGSLSEQFSRYDGIMRGARDLTWSYASFLTTAMARDGNIAF